MNIQNISENIFSRISGTQKKSYGEEVKTVVQRWVQRVQNVLSDTEKELSGEPSRVLSAEEKALFAAFFNPKVSDSVSARKIISSMPKIQKTEHQGPAVQKRAKHIGSRIDIRG